MTSFLCKACDQIEEVADLTIGCVDYIPNFEPNQFFLMPCAFFEQGFLAPPTSYVPLVETLPLVATETEKLDFLEAALTDQRIFILQPSPDPVSVSPTTITIPAMGCMGESTITTGESFTFTQQWNADYQINPYSQLSADWQSTDESTKQAQTALYDLINQYRTHAIGYVDCEGNIYIAHNPKIKATWQESIIYARVEVTRLNAAGSLPTQFTKYQVSVNMGKNQFLSGAGFRMWTNLSTLNSPILNAAFAQ
jgi:hypothetical protein